MAKVIVVGGGPAGIMASLTSAKNNDVILIERNDVIGAKLKLTGGGRCNITNNRDIEEFFDKIVNNKKFLYSALYTFSNYSMLEYLNEHGLEYKEELDQKIYIKSDKADEVIEMFRNDLRNSRVEVRYNTKITDIIVENNIVKGVVTENGNKIFGDKVIVTTGGKSFPNTGSDGAMYEVLKKHGHTITQIYPALIPLVIKENFIKELQGVSMKDVVISAKVKKNKYEKLGDMIFTHFGISGPGVLKLSSYINKALAEGEIEINLDFLQDKSREDLSKIIRNNPAKTVFNNLKGILPQNFLKEIFNLLGLTEVKASDLKKEDENKIIDYIKSMKLTALETLSIKVAQVTSGGVSVKEINSSNMESKIIKNLFFAGEVIDIDAETGGYNLQMAFSTGYLAGSDF
ncbi:MAG: NAD(P)/FAD-dependent oxidoreductase [Clostridium butyricum]|nr:NAD(P)/FAD-dependent oxidoreductase [Clostridium butyricum]